MGASGSTAAKQPADAGRPNRQADAPGAAAGRDAAQPVADAVAAAQPLFGGAGSGVGPAGLLPRLHPAQRHEAILALQRSAGNAAVQRLLAAPSPGAAARGAGDAAPRPSAGGGALGVTPAGAAVQRNVMPRPGGGEQPPRDTPPAGAGPAGAGPSIEQLLARLRQLEASPPGDWPISQLGANAVAIREVLEAPQFRQLTEHTQRRAAGVAGAISWQVTLRVAMHQARELQHWRETQPSFRGPIPSGRWATGDERAGQSPVLAQLDALRHMSPSGSLWFVVARLGGVDAQTALAHAQAVDWVTTIVTSFALPYAQRRAARQASAPPPADAPATPRSLSTPTTGGPNEFRTNAAALNVREGGTPAPQPPGWQFPAPGPRSRAAAAGPGGPPPPPPGAVAPSPPTPAASAAGPAAAGAASPPQARPGAGPVAGGPGRPGGGSPGGEGGGGEERRLTASTVADLVEHWQTRWIPGDAAPAEASVPGPPYSRTAGTRPRLLVRPQPGRQTWISAAWRAIQARLAGDPQADTLTAGELWDQARRANNLVPVNDRRVVLAAAYLEARDVGAPQVVQLGRTRWVVVYPDGRANEVWDASRGYQLRRRARGEEIDLDELIDSREIGASTGRLPPL